VQIGDNHGHVNPIRGLGPYKLAEKFIKSGGWHYTVVNLLSWTLEITISKPQDYEKLYELTIKTAEEMRKHNLKTVTILGPHPAELTKLLERGFTLQDAVNIMKEAYNIAAKYVREGKAHGLGEVGRPHWPVSQDIIRASNQILDYVLILAKDLGCPVHLHLEQKPTTIDDTISRVKKTSHKKVIYHHIPGELVRKAYQNNIIPSVPAKKNEIIKAIKAGPTFVVESDYLDDPRRPGAVVAPWSISRTFQKLIRAEILTDDQAQKILVENIKEIYYT